LLLGWIAGSPIARRSDIGSADVGAATGRSATLIVGANRTLSATVMIATTMAMKIVISATLTAAPLRPVESEKMGALLVIEYRTPSRIDPFCGTISLNL
jgi:hypothetical protein